MKIDAKSILILVLAGALVIYMFTDFFGNNHLKSELKSAKKEHAEQMRQLEEENKRLDKIIEENVAIKKRNDELLAEKDSIIAKITHQHNLSQQEAARLRARLQQFNADFDKMNDDELFEWVRRFIKTNSRK